MMGSIKITVIATGFDTEAGRRAAVEEEPAENPVAKRSHFLRGDDPTGFGPNVSASREDFDIPTILRRQMD